MNEIRMTLEPGHVELTVPPEATVGEALALSGYAMNHPCGGKGRCGKCRIRTRGASAPTAVERDLLSTGELEEGWRLSCVSPVRAGMTVCLPDQTEQQVRILTGEGGLLGDTDTQKLTGCRLACDIGTTTVVLYLLHPETGAIIRTASALNGQIAYGGDVISRIFAVSEEYDRLKELQGAIITTLNRLIEQILTETGLSQAGICEMRVAGNTTMEHLFLGRDPRGLGKSPFQPDFLSAPPCAAEELGLALLPGTPVSVVPNLSAFVGGDITAGIYETGMNQAEGPCLLLDIGTNNEMVLGNRNILYACSAAAGPALEGAQISTGMRAAPGAVEKAWYEGGTLRLKTISDAPPKGLCGSGLIDLLALLVRERIVRPDGRFAAPDELPEGDLRSRLRKGEGRHREFVYCYAGEHNAARELTLTQKDVRETQLAKSAIAVGIEKLLEKMAITPKELNQVYLAGAFGNYIDQKNARELGLLPQVGDEVVRAVHNTAGLGVCRSLFDPDFEARTAHISQIYRSINLAEEADFQQRFLTHLQFTI